MPLPEVRLSAPTIIKGSFRIPLHIQSRQNLIPCFDRPDTFFYLDPPYYGCENYYGDDIFSRYDFVGAILRGLKGKFILSINDHPEMRETFKGFRAAKVKTRYPTGDRTGKPNAVTELLISNY